MFGKILSITIILCFIMVPAYAQELKFLKNFQQDIVKVVEEFDIPGIAIAITDNNKILFQETIGFLDNNSQQPIDKNTIFQIASLSKSFTGALLAILADNKKFSWQDKIIDHVKLFQLKDKTHAAKLTFHHLASMQTGLPAFTSSGTIPVQTREDIIKSFSLNDYDISNIGNFSYQYSIISLFEELIKLKTGLEWDFYLKKNLLTPLNLNDTGVDITKLVKSNIAKPHNENNCPVPWESFRVNSAAGIYSNLNDMVAWVKFHLNMGQFNGRQLISKKEMLRMRGAYTKIQDFSGFLMKDENINFLSYGYFWKNFIFSKNNNIGSNKKLKVIEHNGNCIGMSSIITYLPEKNLGLVVLSNKLTPGPEIIRKKFLEYLL